VWVLVNVAGSKIKTERAEPMIRADIINTNTLLKPSEGIHADIIITNAQIKIRNHAKKTIRMTSRILYHTPFGVRNDARRATHRAEFRLLPNI